MKNIALLSLGLLLSQAAFADRPVLGLPYIKASQNIDEKSFAQGELYFSGGIGIGNLNKPLVGLMRKSIEIKWKDLDVDYKNTWFGKAEYAINNRIGVGANFAYSGLDINVSMDSVTSLNVPVTGSLKYRSWSALARINYHIVTQSNFDLYIGVGMGYKSYSFSVETNDPVVNRWNFPINLGFITKEIPKTLNASSFGADFTIGMRYFIIRPIAIYAEFGVAKSILQAGITIRI